jgi:deazaflavin-dependent oxidoreductase (nitroreductase family)
MTENEDVEAGAPEDSGEPQDQRWPWSWRPGSKPRLPFEDPKNIVWDVLNQAGLFRPLELKVLHYTGISLLTLIQGRWMERPYAPSLILRFVGRKTGQLHTKALAYYPDGDDFVIVGSLGGGPKDPEWVSNLLAHPLSWVRCNRKEYAVRAHLAERAERDRLWSLIGQGTYWADYQERAWPREMPIVVLRPVGRGDQ